MLPLKIQLVCIQFIVTSLFFYIEALMHYNIGKSGYISFSIPPIRQNFLIMGIILCFSFVSSVVTYFLEIYLTN